MSMQVDDLFKFYRDRLSENPCLPHLDYVAQHGRMPHEEMSENPLVKSMAARDVLRSLGCGRYGMSPADARRLSHGREEA